MIFLGTETLKFPVVTVKLEYLSVICNCMHGSVLLLQVSEFEPIIGGFIFSC